MPPDEIFISHKIEDRPIARGLRRALRDLSNRQLEVHVCEEMPGGEDWRKWIEERVGRSKILLFLYTDERADWGWCLFEIGLFIGSHADKTERKNFMICLKDFGISTLPSPIQQFQAYGSDKDNIQRFLNDLLFKGEFTGSCLNHELHTEMKSQFDSAVENICSIFSSTQSDPYPTQATIGFREPGLGQIMPEIETAYIDGDQGTMDMLNIPSTGAKWTILYEQFSKTKQVTWLDELRACIDEIRQGLRPRRVLTPFKTRKGETFIPFLSRIDSKRRMTSQGEQVTIPKTLFVTFIPPERPSASQVQSPEEIIKVWSTYSPCSVVRIRWKRKVDPFKRSADDIIGKPVVSAINTSFAELFCFREEDFPDPDGPLALTSNRLLQNVKEYINPLHLKKLEQDQERVSKKIIFEGMDDSASVPLQFNSQHPKYPGALFLPCLMYKYDTESKEGGPFTTYLLISYVRDFWPVDHPNNPYYQQ